jgi:hypothetical protein
MPVLDYPEIEKAQQVRELSDVQATRMGVHKRNRYGLVLECRSCGTTWSNFRDKNGDFPRDFWVCPLRCNL